MKKFYVYELVFDDGKFYIGYRGSKSPPEEDLLIKYHSSSKSVKILLETGLKCRYTIIQSDLSQETAYNLEQELIFEKFQDSLCLNKACYFGRDGFGVLSENAKRKISESLKLRWNDDEYKKRMSEIHKLRWKDESLMLKEKQILRLTGKSKPEHSLKLKGKVKSEETKAKLRKPKHPGFGALVSASLTGIPKSELHKQNMRKPKPLVVCRIFDRREMALGNFINWCNYQIKNQKIAGICC